MDGLPITTRRAFLTRGLGVVGVGATLPNFLVRTALAGPQTQAGGSDYRVLVLLELSGGNDGPSTLVPFATDGYHRLRKTTRIPTEEVIKLDGKLGLHPNLKGFRDLLDKRAFAAVPGVGYPNPNYSHFEAMDIWHAADPQGKKGAFGPTGWVGRYCDSAFPGDTTPELSLAVVGGVAPVALAGKRHPGMSFYSPDSFRYRGDRGDPRRAALYARLNQPTATGGTPALDYLTHTAVAANGTSEKVRGLAGRYKPSLSYPTTQLATALKTVAGLIAGKLATRVYFVRQTGYDTHSDQKPHHDRLMTELSGAVSTFYQDLTAQGNAGRVLTVTFSEFGRRPEENASQGTDHGSAGPMFLFGPGVKPGVHGPHPSYETFNPHNNFVHTTDFRNVYAAVLEHWLGVPSQPVLGETFPPTDCIA
jgi:uncharacterized protein (DUF1501 family)